MNGLVMILATWAFVHAWGWLEIVSNTEAAGDFFP